MWRALPRTRSRPTGYPRTMCRNARFRGQNSQAHRHAVRGSGRQGPQPHLAAADELEASRSSPPTAAISIRQALRMANDPPPVAPDNSEVPGLGQRIGAPRGRPDAESPRRRPGSGRSRAASATPTKPPSRNSPTSSPTPSTSASAAAIYPRRFRGQRPPPQRRLSQRHGLFPRRYAAHGTDPR